MSERTTLMTEQTIDAGDVRLWAESFGDPRHPAILLVMAAYWQGIAWPDEFCERLAAAGRFVIRYDHRDTGRSTVVDYDAAPYDLIDLADDAVAVLDGYGVARAHVVGGSMGGMIAQELALRHPDRVTTVTSYASTPLSQSYAAGTSESLPGPDEVAWGAFATVAGPGVEPTRDEYADGWTAFSRGVAGTAVAFDEASTLDLHRRSFDRASDAGAVWNHLRATQATPDRLDRLPQLTAPLLVVHGTLDHVIPVAHAHETARLVGGSRLVVVDGLGHQFDSAALGLIADAIVAHTAVAA